VLRQYEPCGVPGASYPQRRRFYKIIYNNILACAHIGHSDTLVVVRVIARGTLRKFVETLKGTKNYAP